MKFIRKFLENKYLRLQMLCCNLLLTLIPLIIYQIIYSRTYFNTLRQNMYEYNNAFFIQVTDHLTNFAENMDTASVLLFLNMDFQEEAIDEMSEPNWKQRQSLNYRVARFSIYHKAIVGTAFIPLESNEIRYASSFSLISPLDIKPVLDRLEHERNNPYQIYITDYCNADGKPSDHFLAIRKIKSVIPPYNNIGYGMLIMNLNALDDMLAKNNGLYGTKYYIVNKENVILSSSDYSFGNDFSEFHNQSNASEENLIIQSQKIQGMEWTLYAIASKDVLLMQGYAFQKLMIQITVVVGLLITIITMLFGFKITHPLEELVKLLQSNKFSGKTSLSPKHHKNEITIIANTIVNIMESNQTLNGQILMARQTLYEHELEKMRFELSGLQSQINSHFLYNTLAIIRGMVLVGNKQEMLSVLEKLIVCLRYSSGNQIIVPIREEMHYLENYLCIQNLRFGNRFHLRSHLTKDEMDSMILKLTIQPIVENAIKHGFDDTCMAGIIDISIKTYQNHIDVRIMDTGKGMSPDHLQVVQRSLAMGLNFASKQRQNQNSIGLINIHRRMQIEYGSMYGLSIQSKAGIGTIVHLLYPKQSKRT